MAKARSGTRRRGGEATTLSPQEYRRRVAEAAYFRALNRGFAGGDPVEDWLAAEREINAALPSPNQQKEEAIVYDKLRTRLRRLLADVEGAMNAETVRHAFDRATEEIRKTGGHTSETVAKVAASLRKDMASAAERLGPKWQNFSRKSADLFDVWRDRGAVFLSQASSAVGEWLQQTGTKLGQQTYRAGETVHRGSFECLACGERVTLATAGHLPPCPRCQGRDYRRV